MSFEANANPFADSSASSYSPPSINHVSVSSSEPAASLVDLSEAPSWISPPDTEEQTAFNEKLQLTQQANQSQAPAPAPAAAPAPFEPEPSPIYTPTTKVNAPSNLPAMIVYMRLGNIALCIMMFLSSILCLTGDNFSTAVLSIYVMAFSCLLCCFETHLKAISQAINENFGFLYNAKGRASFLIFVGLLCFSQGFLGTLAGVGMIMNSLFSFYVIYTCPEYEAIHEAYGQEDGSQVLQRQGGQFLANNPQYAQRAAQGTVSWATSNPEQATTLAASAASASASASAQPSVAYV